MNGKMYEPGELKMFRQSRL